MKKVIIIILLILLIPIVLINIKTLDREEVNPTLTYNLTTTDSTYTDLNNHTLQELFESTIPALENLVTNGDTFSSGFSLVNATGSVVDGVYQFTATAVNGYLREIPIQNLITANVYLVYAKVRYTGTGVQFTHFNIGTRYATSEITGNGSWQIIKHSGITVDDSYADDFRITDSRASGWTQVDVDYLMRFNLTASHGVTETSGTAYDNAVAEIEWLISKNDGYIQSIGNPFEIVDLTVEEMDAWYTIYQNTTYTTLTLGTTTATTYTSLQQLILDNDDKDFKLYRNDVVDESHYRLTQESGYISITNDDDLEIIRINEDDTFESSLQIDDTIDYELVGYNVTSYIDGDVANEVLPLIWLIPIVLVGAVFFIIFTGKDE